MKESFMAAYQKAHVMTLAASAFLKSRTRGKILYVYHELDTRAADKINSPVYKDFITYIRKLALELAPQNTAVNALAVGVSEEYLLTRFGKLKTIQQAQQELIKFIPHAKLVDYNEISNMTSFLVSPLSTGLSGQIIHLDHAL